MLNVRSVSLITRRVRLTSQYEQHMKYAQMNFKKCKIQLTLKNVKQALCDNRDCVIMMRNIRTQRIFDSILLKSLKFLYQSLESEFQTY